jgi:hypothetical protein
MTLNDQIDALKVRIDHMMRRRKSGMEGSSKHLSQEKLEELEGYRAERLELINLRVALIPHRDIERHRLRIEKACCPATIEYRMLRYEKQR